MCDKNHTDNATDLKLFQVSAPSQRWYIPKRYIVAFLGFFGLFNSYAMRVNLSVALVAMVNNPKPVFDNSTQLSTECPRPDITLPNENLVYKGARYDWNPEMQGWVMSSFFYGYFITGIVGGYVAERYAATRVFGTGLFLTGILTLLSPLAVSWGVVPFLVVRFLEGLGEGVTFPAITSTISRWSPKMERSRMISFVFAGSNFGSVITLSTSGWLCSSDFMGGWPSVFYVFGFITCVWYGLWITLVYETPRVHPYISAEEMLLIDGGQRIKNFKVPWKAIFTSLPFWTVMVTNIGMLYGSIIYFTELPTYLSTVHHFSIEAVGMLSAVPYACLIVCMVTSSICADKLRASGKIKITNIRKLFNSLGGYGAAVALLAITLVGCRPYIVLIFIAFGMGINGLAHSGFTASFIDLSPDFAGTLMGFTNGVASLSGLIGPAIVGVFTSDGYTIANWNKVFYLTAAIYLVTTTVYLLFSSAELQPWGKAKGEDMSDCMDTKSQQMRDLKIDACERLNGTFLSMIPE